MDIQKKVSDLMAEADKNSQNSAEGYDAGFYTGEYCAYEKVLEILGGEPPRRHEKTVKVPAKLLSQINKYLREEPKDESECLGEDETISVTAQFENGIEMDIKCCGVQFEEGGNNTAWTEAVLFRNGSQIACTEVCDIFEDKWELEDGDDIYCVNIVPEEQEKPVKITVPCKIGDYVWAIRKYQGVPCPRCGKVIEMFITEDMKLMIVVSHVARGYWGETVFPTYEDAVAAIEKKE